MAFFISGIYYICYGQKILRLSVEEPLTKEQIQVVEERLKLKEKRRVWTMAREQFQTLTEPMYYILIALSEECCGVDIMEKVQKISGGRVKVGPGTLYTMLSKFEENQIIFRTKEEGRRKSYVITEHGRKLLQEEHERLCIMLADWNGYFDKNLLYYNNRQEKKENER